MTDGAPGELATARPGVISLGWDCDLDDVLDLGRVWVAQADPRVLISRDLLDLIWASPHDQTATGPWQSRAVTFDGTVLRIEATNRTLVYRVSGYTSGAECCVAEWPD